MKRLPPPNPIAAPGPRRPAPRIVGGCTSILSGGFAPAQPAATWTEAARGQVLPPDRRTRPTAQASVDAGGH